MNTVSLLVERLKSSGIGSSRVNAEVMLSSVADCRTVDLYTDEIRLDDSQLAKLDDMIVRRINGEPLQYIIGKCNFYGCELFVEPGVFIPRPETEILVDVVINTIHDSQPTIHDPLILDLCTGSGNVAIALTKTLTNCKIISSDISGKALLLVKKNALLNGVSERIEFIKADLFKIQDIYRGSFDIIVSNPPYISSEKLAGLPDEVKMEPKEALNGGTGGLDFYKRIIKESPEFLKKKGFLALELDDTISDSVKKLFLATDTFRGVKVYKDLSSIDRVIVAQRR